MANIHGESLRLSSLDFCIPVTPSPEIAYQGMPPKHIQPRHIQGLAGVNGLGTKCIRTSSPARAGLPCLLALPSAQNAQIPRNGHLECRGMEASIHGNSEHRRGSILLPRTLSVVLARIDYHPVFKMHYEST